MPVNAMAKLLGFCALAAMVTVPIVVRRIFRTIVNTQFKQMRSTFRKSYVPLNTKGTTPEHLNNGTIRNSAVDFVYYYCRKLGLRPYWISPRLKHVRSGAAYQSHPFWYEDLLPSHKDAYSSDDCFVLFDVDYYLTMDQLSKLASNFRPILLFTFSPNSVCGINEEMNYHSLPNQNVKISYNAGGRYEHPLWDFDVEFVGFRYRGRHYLYQLERKRLSDTRELIILIPKISRMVSQRRDRPHYLNKRVMHVGNMQAQLIVTKEGKRLHFAANGSCEPTSLDVDVVETCRVRLKHMEKPSPAMVEQHIKNFTSRPTHFACLLFEYLRSGSSPTITTVYGYCANADTVAEAESSYRLLHPPNDPNGSAPLRTRANDAWCTSARIEAVRSHVDFPDKYEQRLVEFVDMFSELVPVSLEVVAKRQNRPTQRALRAAAGPVYGDHNFKLRSFQKAESYPEAKPPRNITTVDTGFKTVYSTYTYALFEYCQRFNWFAPGKTPLEISQGVLSLSQIGPLSEADYSKFDGSKSPAAVHIERAILNKCFPKGDALECFNKQINATAVTSCGITYNVGTTRLSGSPDTTILNTLINAFVAYCASGTFDFLVSGDDIIYTGDMPIEITASDLGYTLEVLSKPKYPTFLGRVYHNLPLGPETIYDVRRFDAKSHVCVASKNVPINVAASRRAQGYLITDPHTPLVTDWCHAMLKRYGKCNTTKYDHLIELPYNVFDAGNNYPVSFDLDLTAVVCELLDISVEMLQQHISNYSAVEVSTNPSLISLKIPDGVLVDGVAGPTKTETPSSLPILKTPHGSRRARVRRAQAQAA